MIIPGMSAEVQQLLGRVEKAVSALHAPPPRRTETTRLVVAFRFQRDGEPVAGERFRCVDDAGAPIHALRPGRTTAGGLGFVYQERARTRFRGDHVRLQIGSLGLRVDLPSGSGIERHVLDGGLVLECARNAEVFVVRPPRPEHPRTFHVALVGDAERLRAALPLFRGKRCTRIARIYVEGEAGAIAKAAHGIEVVDASALDGEPPEGLDAILDLVGSTPCEALRQARRAGRHTRGPIVLSLAASGAGISRLAELVAEIVERREIRGGE